MLKMKQKNAEWNREKNEHKPLQFTLGFHSNETLLGVFSAALIK